MANVLFIKANNRPIEQSVSVKLYHAFLDSYKESHPDDEIVELDLFEENLPYYDNLAMTAIFKNAGGMKLTPAEERLLAVADRCLDPLLAADKVVFAFPLWNLSVPAVLKNYFDYIIRAGKTFRYTPEGPVGLLSKKKVTILNARGSTYSDESSASFEMAVNFVTKNLNMYFGFHDITSVIVEGHKKDPEQEESIIQEGVQRARETAMTF